MRNDKCLAFVHAIVLTNNSGPLHESYPPEGMIFFIYEILIMMTKQLSSETVDTVDNGAKTSVENVVENAAKSKVETGTNKHERNRRRSSDFDEEDWQEKGKVIDEVKICSYENNYKEVYFAKQTDTSISTVRRIFSFRTQKTAASWSSIFKLVKCLSNECVNANHLVVLLGTMLLYLVGNAAKVHFYLEGNRKFFIEIKFKKDVTVFKKGEKEPVGDNERRNIDDEFK